MYAPRVPSPRARSTQTWDDGLGAASLETATPNVIRIEIRGYLSGDIGAKVAAALEQALREADAVRVFCDMELVTAYDSSVRTDCTRALRNHWSSVDSLYVLVRATHRGDGCSCRQPGSREPNHILRRAQRIRSGVSRSRWRHACGWSRPRRLINDGALARQAHECHPARL
jgi:hypothetical protein